MSLFDISILCPTKYRPEGLEKMWESAIDTADSPDSLELVVYVEHYDTETLNKLEELEQKYGSQILKIIGQEEVIYSSLHNICCENSSADLFFCGADDLVFRSQGWDTSAKEVFKEYNDNIVYAYPNDGHWGSELGTHGVFHKDWYNTLGYIAPAIFTVDYSDNYIMDVSRAIGRAIYIPHILVEHMHWTFGKSEFDKTAQEAHSRRASTNNGGIYQSYETKQIQNQDIEKLKALIGPNK